MFLRQKGQFFVHISKSGLKALYYKALSHFLPTLLSTMPYQLKEEEAKQLLKNAIQAAFLNERDKKALQAYIMQRYAISL